MQNGTWSRTKRTALSHGFRFRGGLVFKAHRLLHHSRVTPGRGRNAQPFRSPAAWLSKRRKSPFAGPGFVLALAGNYRRVVQINANAKGDLIEDETHSLVAFQQLGPQSGANRLFQVLDLYWRSSKSDGSWCKSRKMQKATWSRTKRTAFSHGFRFRGGLVLKAHRLVHHSTLASRVTPGRGRSAQPCRSPAKRRKSPFSGPGFVLALA